jgi:NAD(P)-dependent dehydrogenase (short-subunit alcohol dehydrogenase family)
MTIESAQAHSETVIQGKVVVITGATSGIGLIAAERLATLGARIVLVARDPARAQATLARLAAASPGASHSVRYADLSRLADMKRVAGEIAAAEPRVDALINNAGALFSRRSVTEDGLERTFALNHMSYFVLTAALRHSLIAAAPARIINTASNAHRNGHLDFDDLQSAESYRGSRAYGTSKLCNILFTRELARQLAGLGVTANSFSPGFVATRFGDEAGGIASVALRAAKLLVARSPEVGARTLVYLASSPDVADVSGEFFYKCGPGKLTPEAQNDDKARRLWAVSEEIAKQTATPQL